MGDEQSFMKPAEGNTPSFFFSGDEGIDTTTGAQFDMGAVQSFDSIDAGIFPIPPETDYGMQRNLSMDNTVGNASWNSQFSPIMNDFVAPNQSFASMYQPQFSHNKRPLQLDTHDFPQPKRHESTDYTGFSPFATSGSVTGSSWTIDTQPTPSSSIEIGLSDEAADVCATWFSKYAILPSDKHVESLSQLTGESSSAIRHWFGQMLKQGLAGHDSAYKSQTSLSQQDQSQSTNEDTTSSQTSQAISCNHETAHTSTTQPILRGGRKGCTPTSDPELLCRDPTKIYQCTRKCGKRYGRKCDWKRNEEEGYPSKSWMCSLCKSQGADRVKPCFRRYHFSQHFKNIHPGLNSADYEDESVFYTDTAFPRKCGFCPHRFVSRQDRIDHIADHFKKGKCMLDWNDEEDDSSDNTDDDDDRPDTDGSDDNRPSDGQSDNDDQNQPGPKQDFNGNGGGNGFGGSQFPPSNAFTQFDLSEFKCAETKQQSAKADASENCGNYNRGQHSKAIDRDRQVISPSHPQDIEPTSSRSQRWRQCSSEPDQALESSFQSPDQVLVPVDQSCNTSPNHGYQSRDSEAERDNTNTLARDAFSMYLANPDPRIGLAPSMMSPQVIYDGVLGPQNPSPLAYPLLPDEGPSNANKGEEIMDNTVCQFCLLYPVCLKTRSEGSGQVLQVVKPHMRTHGNHQPEKCPIATCEYHPKCFAGKYTKDQDTLTHSKGTWVCCFCPDHPKSSTGIEKTFNRADLFKRHLARFHNVRSNKPSAGNLKLVTEKVGDSSACFVIYDNARKFYKHLDNCILGATLENGSSQQGLRGPKGIPEHEEGSTGADIVNSSDTAMDDASDSEESRSWLHTPRYNYPTPTSKRSKRGLRTNAFRDRCVKNEHPTQPSNCADGNVSDTLVPSKVAYPCGFKKCKTLSNGCQHKKMPPQKSIDDFRDPFTHKDIIFLIDNSSKIRTDFTSDRAQFILSAESSFSRNKRQWNYLNMQCEGITEYFTHGATTSAEKQVTYQVFPSLFSIVKSKVPIVQQTSEVPQIKQEAEPMDIYAVPTSSLETEDTQMEVGDSDNGLGKPDENVPGDQVAIVGIASTLANCTTVEDLWNMMYEPDTKPMQLSGKIDRQATLNSQQPLLLSVALEAMENIGQLDSTQRSSLGNIFEFVRVARMHLSAATTGWSNINTLMSTITNLSQTFLSVKLLGTGGFSTVDEVIHRETNLRVGRKTLKNRERSAMEELKKEVTVLQKLRHPHIIRFLGAYSKGDKVSILLSPVAETTLAAWLAQNSLEKPSGLSATIVKMYGCLASSVRYLHEQRPIVKHMDIKPQNILVMHGNYEHPHVVLSDFGISSSDDIAHGPHSTPLTRQYCAPEVPAGVAREQTADIWSLGCVFLEMAGVAFGHDKKQWHRFRHEFCGCDGKYYWQNVPLLQKYLSELLDQSADLLEATVLHTVKSMLHNEPTERPDATRLTMIFTPAPCCLSWPNDNVAFPGPLEELSTVEMLIHEDGVDCLDHLQLCHGVNDKRKRESFKQAQTWLDECSQSHSACRQQTDDAKTLPTRLLKVQPSDNAGLQVKIISSADMGSEQIDYAVISHMWSSSDLILTDELLQDTAGVLPRDILSRPIANAISTASCIGYRYIWLDSLCILQDSEEEKQRECAAMASVYRNASLTIVVDNKAPDPTLDWYTTGFAWDTRAWSLQERLLSRRLLHTAGEQMYWECNALKASETFPQGLPPLVWEKVHTKGLGMPAPISAKSEPASGLPRVWRDCQHIKREDKETLVNSYQRLALSQSKSWRLPLRRPTSVSTPTKQDDSFHFEFSFRFPSKVSKINPSQRVKRNKPQKHEKMHKFHDHIIKPVLSLDDPLGNAA
ncbi:hypothetical protein CC78DRAFT_587149 [Lojkania enalia]|uniref:Protein kinase domain-containing protein n=1 Tax=Lojkania enalia TaxID=147567 RepID=A0A9P4JXJ8_9PLEO|nr:hypothetical protein CC78DRAFT_587149 [Didymosphaeria enalia]